MNVTAIVLGAGQGRRMGANKNKIWLELAGKPVLQYSLERFEQAADVRQIIVVAAEAEVAQAQALVERLGLSKAGTVVAGGSTRLRSVAAALPYISCTADLVAVHDGARPLFTAADLQAVLAAAALPGYAGAILAAPVTDTIKLVGEGACAGPGELLGPIEATLARERLWRALTPQVFGIEPFIEAYSGLDKDFTDDAALLAAHGGRVGLVWGSEDNIKITTPRDLLLTELILQNRG